MTILNNHAIKLFLIFFVCFFITSCLKYDGFSTDGEVNPPRYEKNKDGTLTDKQNNKIINRYIDNGDATITDRYAGLMMFQAPLRLARYYDEAEIKIKEFNFKKYKGYSDWRLPTAQEWNKKIMDKSQSKSPRLPAGHPFKNVSTFVCYWSETDDINNPGRKWCANLSKGKLVNLKESYQLFVWPVRDVVID